MARVSFCSTMIYILPQTPKDESQWKKDFTDEQRIE
jgi:hypothetical protein